MLNWPPLKENLYYYDDAVCIYCADCRLILPQLPKVDLVVTSPPFNLGNTHHTGNNRFNPYEDEMPEDEYQGLQIYVLNLLYQLVAKNGHLFYQHKNRIKDGVQITPYEWLLKTPWLIKQEIVWFNGSQNFDKCRFYPMTERIYWLGKTRSSKIDNVINRHDLWEIDPEGLDCPHPRAIPIEIPQNLIACCPEAKLILDPYMGWGTTLRAAKNLERKAIGIDDKEWCCELAAKRMSQTVMALEITR